MSRQILGVDIGGVIISKTLEGNSYPPIKDAFEVLGLLGREKFKDNIFLVSRVDSRVQEENILNWLNGFNFYGITGITRENIYFCRERREKSPICQTLGITHFIDDRTEVLEHLYSVGILNLFLFQGREEEMEPRKHLLPRLRQVTSWQEIKSCFYLPEGLWPRL